MARKKREQTLYTIKRIPGRKSLYITWSENREPKRISTGQADWADAETYLRNFVAGLNAPPDTKQVTVDMTLKAYREVKRTDGSAYATIANALQPIEAFFGPLLLENITPALSREYISERRKLGRANDTIRREMGTLRAAINHCIKEGWKIISPVINLPPASPPRERWLTSEEVKRLIAEAREEHLRLFIVLAFTTGQRKNAILSLTWDRVDLVNGLIDFKTPGEAQTKKYRGVVRINRLSREVLERALETAQSDYVIEWAGKPVSNIRRSFMTAVEAAGLKGKVTPHVMRHTAAVRMAMEGVPMRDIAAVLGHKSSRITEEVYLKYHPDFQIAAVTALEVI